MEYHLVFHMVKQLMLHIIIILIIAVIVLVPDLNVDFPRLWCSVYHHYVAWLHYVHTCSVVKTASTEDPGVESLRLLGA